ncbi:carbon-nitrogen family hydrolase [Oceanobacillus polygoni]|uniref:Amidohydrolase n=1 Tax=Oceanobacillus polygoni TaxID=1235259 RepID=A0A9X0YST6_9BACI|nr:carbon-nitrogen family hydrolase [Oceanobacillus polygoni]MBP2076366.1 putative amidohydrolase [Oceanobacillus polygoni]
MKHAIYQMEIIPGDPEGNRRKIKRWVEETARTENPDVIVLPEMWTTSYTLDELEKLADRDGEPSLSFLQEVAKANHVHIIGGSIPNMKNGNIYNTSFVVNKAGELVYQYDKIHLVPMLNEPAYLTGGTEKVQLFELDGVKMGLIICYDLRFPELARSLALKGAEVLYIVAEWPKARGEHWKALQIARAIENQFYVVSCNCVGTHDGVEFSGNSMVVDPWGNTLKLGSEQHEETLIESIALENVKTFRNDVPIFTSRVPEMYEL